MNVSSVVWQLQRQPAGEPLGWKLGIYVTEEIAAPRKVDTSSGKALRRTNGQPVYIVGPRFFWRGSYDRSSI